MNDVIDLTPMPAESAPMRMLEMAVRSSAPIETLERLMAMHERHEANEARKAYVAAVAAFKAEGVTVTKDRHVKQGAGKPDYWHASLANIVGTVGPYLGRHGLTATWRTTQDGNSITVTCMLRHALGHSEDVALTAAPDTGPGRNSIQAIASTVSYLERYTFTAILGIAAEDQDDDGEEGGKTKLTDEQQELVDYLKQFAREGLAAYAAAYRAMQPASRKLLPAEEHEKLKAMASAAEDAERGNGNA